jgi:hypothetical protein
MSHFFMDTRVHGFNLDEEIILSSFGSMVSWVDVVIKIEWADGGDDLFYGTAKGSSTNIVVFTRF